MKFTALLLLSAATSSVFAQKATISEVLNNPQLSSLKATLSAYPDLLAAVAAQKDITVLAPNNAAFEKLMASEMFQAVKDDPEVVQAILKYHVLGSKVPSSALSQKAAFPPTLLKDYKPFVKLGGTGQVVKAVVEGSDAYFYSGLGMKSKVLAKDVEFTTGTAHVIDSVLTPPMSVSDTAKAANLTALVNALVTADLVKTVDDLEKVTIFAPSNAAFGELTATPSKADLAKVLTYHVVPGAVGYSTSLAATQKLKTVNGAELTVVSNSTGVFVNNAKVIAADVLVNSGVVHVIDKVLMPAAAPPATSTPPPMSNDGHHHCRWSGPAVVGCFLAAAWGAY